MRDRYTHYEHQSVGDYFTSVLLGIFVTGMVVSLLIVAFLYVQAILIRRHNDKIDRTANEFAEADKLVAYNPSDITWTESAYHHFSKENQ